MEAADKKSKIQKIYVSDYIQSRGGIDAIFEEEKTNLACIVSGTGSGKSYWIRNILAKSGKVLYVTSRSAKVLQDEGETETGNFFSPYFNSGTSTICNNWQLHEHIMSLCQGKTQEEDEKRVINFINAYDYIVFDEVHSLVCDSLFSDSSFNVIIFFCHCLFTANKKTIILTATKQPVEFFLDAVEKIYQRRKTGIAMLDLTQICAYALPQHIFVLSQNKRKHAKIKEWLKDHARIIYFMNFVGDDHAGENNNGNNIWEEYDFLMECGLKATEVAVIISRNKQKEWDEKHGYEPTYTSRVKTDEDGSYSKITYNEWIREEIALNNEVPDKVRVLLCSATLNEGISIENESQNPFRYVITDAHYISTIIQQMGRLRRGVKEFWVIGNKQQHKSKNDDIERAFLRKKLPETKGILACFTEYAETIADNDERRKFITWICKEKGFSLLAYSDISHRFEFNDLRYQMREAVKKSEEQCTEARYRGMRNWELDLFDFAAAHDVSIKGSRHDTAMSTLHKLGYARMHIREVGDTRFWRETWKAEQAELQRLGLGATQKTINRTLSQLGAGYRLCKKQDKDGCYSYWFEPTEE